MLEKIPTSYEMIQLLGEDLFEVWQQVCHQVEEIYDMEHLWNSGGKKWIYEYKYRRGGKTLCTLYVRKNCFGFMVILGKAERAKFETERENYSSKVIQLYEESETYHDGKWIMFELKDLSLMEDIKKLLGIKRRPNRK